MSPAFALLLASSLPAQELPLLAEAIAAKNWFFERAVHPETNLIYSRVNLDDPDVWRKTAFASPGVNARTT